MVKSLIETAPNRIDLWQVDLAADQAGLCESVLSADESLRAEKFAFSKDRDTFVRSRAALRLILSRYLNCQAGELEFQYNEHGKPRLQFPSIGGPGFNLSHSGEEAVIAIARGRNVGVDMSILPGTGDQNLEWLAVAKRSFSPAEQTLLFALPAASQERMFYLIWSQKEAYTKGIGEGYRYGFQRFTVAVDARGGTGLIADEKNPRHVGEWQLTRIDTGRDSIAVLAYDGPQGPRIRKLELRLNSSAESIVEISANSEWTD